MQAGDVRLGQVFANDHQNVIPLFQRPYVWDEQDNWLPLWADVREACEEVEAEARDAFGARDQRTYFLGAVVLQQRMRAPRRLASSHIIDGQQRLTTIQVLIASARAVAAKLGAPGPEGRFKSLLENRNETVDPLFPQDRFKVWPLPGDRDAFFWAVRSPGDDAIAAYDGHKLVRAREWFEAAVAEWAQASTDPVARLDFLHETLNERMQIVEISLDRHDDPQVIYEALNHKGVPLDAADLVKNLLFQRIEQQGDGASAEDLLDTWWKPLDSPQWRNDVTTGRLRRARIDLLLSYWLTLTVKEEVLSEHLFADFKNWLLGPGNDERAVDVVRRIRHHANTYLAMRQLNEHDQTRQLLDRMDTSTATPWPTMLYLHANAAIPAEQRALAAAAIDSYLTRRAACGLTIKDYNRLFLQVAVAALAAPPEMAGQAVVDTLAAQEADSRYWPGDDEFAVALARPELYRRMNRQALKTLLVGLENYLRTGKTEPQPLLASSDSRLNIEHLIPQKWDNWPLVPPDDEERLAERLEAVHALGNLTLVTKRLNPAMSNRAWADKRQLLQSHSLMRLTTASVWTAPEGVIGWTNEQWAVDWDEARVRERTSWMTRLALTQWAAPEHVTQRPSRAEAASPQRPATSAPREPGRSKSYARDARESAFPHDTYLHLDPAKLGRDRSIPVASWIAEDARRGTAVIDWMAPRDYLVWAVDGHHYSPTSLAQHVVDCAASDRPLGPYNGALAWHDENGTYLADVS